MSPTHRRSDVRFLPFFVYVIRSSGHAPLLRWTVKSLSIKICETLNWSNILTFFSSSTSKYHSTMPSNFCSFCCPKINPFVAYCIVVIIFLFTYYHRNDINTFITSISHNINTTMNDTMTEWHKCCHNNEFHRLSATKLDEMPDLSVILLIHVKNAMNYIIIWSCLLSVRAKCECGSYHT